MPRPLLFRNIVRALVLWGLVRVLFTVMTPEYAALDEVPAWLDAIALFILVPLPAVLCQVDARVMRESVFIANLGIPQRATFVISLLVAAAAELLLRAVL